MQLVSSDALLTVMRRNSYTVFVSLIITFFISSTNASAADLLHTYPFFHSTPAISSKLSDLSNTCKMDMKLESFVLAMGNKLDVVTLTSNSDSSSDVEPLRMFMLFGEHARELISSESGLSFIERLCTTANPQLPETCHSLPPNFIIRIIPNANPASRSKVESGDFCLRTNENGVDLNRNWADHWMKSSQNGEETFPGMFSPTHLSTASSLIGSTPFSEAETKIIRDKLVEFQPDVFLTVHSGNCAYMTPFAFSTKEPNNSFESRWLSILDVLEKHGPKCPEGPAARLVGYKSSGTCLDYAFDVVKTPYPFGFEIYQPSNFSTSKFISGHSTRSNKFRRRPHETAINNRSGFPSKTKKSWGRDGLERIERMREQQEPTGVSKDDMDKMCLEFFNPLTFELYNTTLDRWNENYFCLLASVAETEKNHRKRENNKKIKFV